MITSASGRLRLPASSLQYVLPLVSLFLVVPRAHAGERSKSRAVKPAVSEETAVGRKASKAARERAAKRACLTGDVERGVEFLADLYIDTNDTNYIFNQGRCL